MDKRDFLLEIAQNRIQSLYILEGEEKYLKQEALHFMLQKYMPQDFAALNVMRLQDPKVQSIIEISQMPPLMCDKRFVLVQGFSLIESGKEKVSNPQEADEFIEFTKHIPETTVLIISIDGKADVRKKTTKHCASRIYSFLPFKKEEASKYLIDQAKLQNKTLSKAVADQIQLAVGNDAASLKQELLKLFAFCEDGEITSQAVSAITSKSVGFSVYQMTDALLAGQMKQALDIQKQLLKNGENEYMLFAMLLRECRLNYYTKILALARKSIDEIAKITDSRDFAVQKRLNHLYKLQLSAILKAYRYCIDTDLAIKEGRMSQTGIAERTLIGIYAILNNVV
ncbi:MAG: DNA polymerase III subunit delta [Eubacteriales bacterium]|nr:DNA polymerase III subunit delta [Eubacteriales bacterium]